MCILVNYRVVNRTIAHELGHGLAAMSHTFNAKYGTIPEGTTNNLMDYSVGIAMQKLQWDALHSKVEVWKMFERDKDAMYSTDGHLYTVQLVANLMGMSPTDAYKLGVTAEMPDNRVLKKYENINDGIFVQEIDWRSNFLPEKIASIISKIFQQNEHSRQINYHALTGRTHGVELALTVYAILTGFPEPENEMFLLHRFGDCFGHTNTDNKDVMPLVTVELKSYHKAVENSLTKYLALSDNGIVRKRDGDTVFIPLNDSVVVVKKLDGNSIVFDNLDLYTTKTDTELKHFFIGLFFEEKLENPIYEYIAGGLLALLQEELNNITPAVQNTWKMYKPFLGHVLDNYSAQTHPDVIGSRLHLYFYYVRKLCDLFILQKQQVSRFNAIQPANLENTVSVLSRVVNYNSTSDYSILFAFEIARYNAEQHNLFQFTFVTVNDDEQLLKNYLTKINSGEPYKYSIEKRNKSEKSYTIKRSQ